MGRNNTRAAKNIAKMYEQLGLSQDDIYRGFDYSIWKKPSNVRLPKSHR